MAPDFPLVLEPLWTGKDIRRIRTTLHLSLSDLVKELRGFDARFQYHRSMIWRWECDSRYPIPDFAADILSSYVQQRIHERTVKRTQNRTLLTDLLYAS